MMCQNCHTENQKDSKFCIKCGSSLTASVLDDGIRRSSSSVKRYAQGKNPTLAAFLSFLIVGVGQIYNGDVLKGILLFIACVLLSFTVIGAFGIWGYGIYDAYQVAKGNQSLWK